MYLTSKLFISVASNIYSSDEDGSDVEAVRPKKNVKSKAIQDSDESNSGSESGSGSGGEAEEAAENDASD